MSNITVIIAIVIFLLAINFGTHYVRTWAFNRYEAVTFECSAIALLLSFLLIYRYGFRKELLLLSLLLLVMFVGNAMSQWHFYMTLQRIIDKAFDKRMSYMENHDPKFIFTNRALLLMASVAIMPSFSRFIEESKLFNNPGNLLGLIKSIMKRERFQKQKYRMRECFAENVNLIGPCKPEITSMKIMAKDERQGKPGREKGIPGAIRPNDLALNYTQEKWGLFAFDTLGFGALIIIFVVIKYLYFHPLERAAAPTAVLGAFKVAGLVAVLALFIALGHLLRLFAFARRESVHYEISFVALVVSAYRVFDAWLYGEKLSAWHYVVLAVAILTFGIHSFINRKLDKAFHKEVDQRYETIMKKIPIDTETGRTRRKFLENLEVINEWAISPFLVRKKKSPESEKKTELKSAGGKQAKTKNASKTRAFRPRLLSTVL